MQSCADPARRLQWMGFPVRAAAPAARTLRKASAAPGAASGSGRLRKRAPSRALFIERPSYIRFVLRSGAPHAEGPGSGFGPPPARLADRPGRAGRAPSQLRPRGGEGERPLAGARCRAQVTDDAIVIARERK